MKAVIIGIVLLFLAIFGAKSFYEIKEERATEQAEEDYKNLLKERELLGDSLSKTTLLAQFAADSRPNLFGSKVFETYFSEKGYTFNASTLEKPARFGQSEAQKVFASHVGKFGPTNLDQWKRLLIPSVKTDPSDRMLASKILRNFEEWEEPIQALQDTFFEVEKESGILGLHLLREKEAEVKAALLTKVHELVEAQVTLGRLQLNKQDRSRPYATARDLILFANMFLNEAVENDETRLGDQIEDLVNSYISYLSENGGDSQKLGNLQRLMLEDNLSKALYTRVRLKRISSKEKLEENFLGMTKTERDALGIFESGYVLTPKEMWLLLEVYVQAGVILNYDNDGEDERVSFTGDVLDEAGSYINEKKQELALNKDADLLFTSTMRELEKQAFVIVEKFADRYAVAVEVAVDRYTEKKRSFPTEFEDLTEEYLPYSPKNPLTGEPFKVVLSSGGKKGGKPVKPTVRVELQRRSRIK